MNMTVQKRSNRKWSTSYTEENSNPIFRSSFSIYITLHTYFNILPSLNPLSTGIGTKMYYYDRYTKTFEQNYMGKNYGSNFQTTLWTPRFPDIGTFLNLWRTSSIFCKLVTNETLTDCQYSALILSAPLLLNSSCSLFSRTPICIGLQSVDHYSTENLTWRSGPRSICE